MATHNLDARDILCPLPVIKTQNAISGLHPEDVLVVTATDPGALIDIPAWCRINGHTVLESGSANKEIVVHILVGSP